jgi:hypothetical protein
MISQPVPLHLPVSKLTISRSTANQTNQQAASIHHTQEMILATTTNISVAISPVTFQLLNVPTKLNNVKSLDVFEQKKK